MRRVQWLAVACLLAWTSASAAGQAPSRSPRGARRLEVDGRTRTYHLTVPDGVRRGTPLPLLLVFHGLGGTGEEMREMTGFDAWAKDRGFIVAYPDAVPEARRGWAMGCELCTPADRLGIDDVRFTRAVLDDIRGRYPVDGARVFAAGFSMGGWLAYLLGCRMGGEIRAIAAVGGLYARPTSLACAPGAPVSAAIFMGATDVAQPWQGRTGPYGVLGALETAGEWGRLNGCAPTPAREERRAQPMVVRWRYSGCSGGTRVELHRLEGIGHVWLRMPGFDQTGEVVDFFLGRPGG